MKKCGKTGPKIDSVASAVVGVRAWVAEIEHIQHGILFFEMGIEHHHQLLLQDLLLLKVFQGVYSQRTEDLSAVGWPLLV